VSAEQFVKPADLEKLKKEMDSKITAQKRSITDLSNAEREASGGHDGLRAALEGCCTRE